MEMTENMKRSVVEGLQKKGLELSDEQLDEITGGRDLTSRERSLVMFTRAEVAYKTDNFGPVFKRMEPRYYELAAQYKEYIASLPEGSPEVIFTDTEYYKELWEGTTPRPSF